MRNFTSADFIKTLKETVSVFNLHNVSSGEAPTWILRRKAKRGIFSGTFKTILLVFVFAVFWTNALISQNTINTGTITGFPFCESAATGASVSVPYTISSSFNTGNVFTAQLSDAGGNFSSPATIGTLNGVNNRTHQCHHPSRNSGRNRVPDTGEWQ